MSTPQMTAEQQQMHEIREAYLKVALEESKELPEVQEFMTLINAARAEVERKKEELRKAGNLHNKKISALRDFLLARIPEKYRDIEV